MLIMRQQQQFFAFTACLCSVVIVLVSAVPLPANNQELDVLQIPLSDDKELDVLTLSARDQEQLIAERNKRTIGLLRELFPDITKQIDDQVNRIVSKLLRTLGPTILRTAVQGNTANRARANFDADFDDDNEESSSSSSDSTSSSSSDTSSSSSSSSSSSTSVTTSNGASTRVTIELPTFAPDDNNDDDEDNEVGSTDNGAAAAKSTK